jgi:hypothetical protein
MKIYEKKEKVRRHNPNYLAKTKDTSPITDRIILIINQAKNP